MQGGDISNEVERVPRTLVVWEGYLALYPAKFWKFKGRSAKPFINSFELNVPALDLMWDRAWRANQRFEIITFLRQGDAAAITERMEGTFYDFGPVQSTTPQRLARDLVHFPDIVRVCDPDPTHYLTYGGRGLHVSPERPRFWS